MTVLRGKHTVGAIRHQAASLTCSVNIVTYCYHVLVVLSFHLSCIDIYLSFVDYERADLHWEAGLKIEALCSAYRASKM